MVQMVQQMIQIVGIPPVGIPRGYGPHLAVGGIEPGMKTSEKLRKGNIRLSVAVVDRPGSISTAAPCWSTHIDYPPIDRRAGSEEDSGSGKIVLIRAINRSPAFCIAESARPLFRASSS